MFILALKITLAVLLTAIPFFFRYWIKPISEKQPKWRSLFSFLEYNRPSFSKKKRLLKICYLKVVRRLRFSVNARKLYTYILIFVLLGIQVVDYRCSLSATERLEASGTGVSPGRILAGMADGTVASPLIWYANTTPFEVLAGCLAVTLLLFSFRLADFILTGIHNRKFLRWLLIGAIILLIPAGFGRLFLLAETLYLFLLAGLFYPNLDFKSGDKWRRGLETSLRQSMSGRLFVRALRSLADRGKKAA